MKTRFLFGATVAALLTAAPALASVEINGNPTKNMTCSGGTCSPTAKSAVLNTTDLANMLATSDVKVTTGNGAVTITVSGPFSWTSTHRLTLDANVSVSFRAPVEVTGQGAVTIVTNDGGTGGDLLFFPGGKLDFSDPNSSLVINKTDFTIVSDIATLASHIEANASGNFALAVDYDAAADGSYAVAPVETLASGTFEGLGHTISNLTVGVTLAKEKMVGLFAGFSAGALRDLNLINANVAGVGDYKAVGALVGYSAGAIIQCSATGTVTGGGFTTQTGGLAGGATDIIRSHADVIVKSGGGYSGGLAGSVRHSISDSYATGSVSDDTAGGLVGSNNAIIERSHATGQVRALQFSGGGLVGDNTAQISQSYATGDVAGGEWAGGLAGATDAPIFDSYAMGQTMLSREGSIGGLVGEANTTNVSRSYSTGRVTKQANEKKGGYIGSIVGTSLKAGYWDITTSGLRHGWGKCTHEGRECRKISGLTDSALKAALPPSFNSSVWAQGPNINNGYPYLINNPPPQ